jgi:uncharacterized membrane protein YkvA (DUF1232 family)
MTNPERPHAEEPPTAASRSIEAAPSFPPPLASELQRASARRSAERAKAGETRPAGAPQDEGGSRLRKWARSITRDVHALYLAARDPRVPWYAKLAAGCVAAYALSPIDLIPDFIPVLGYLDDLIIVPIGILLVVALIPPGIMAEHRATAAAMREKPRSMSGAITIIALWTALTVVAAWLALRLLES